VGRPLEVECRRTYAAPAERIFRAFTDPEVIERWWSPDPRIAVDVLEWTPVSGARWRFAYRFPDGDVIRVGGEFLDVEPDRRLAFTWTWEPPDPHAGIKTLVDVTLEERAGATMVHVRHRRFPTRESRDRHDAGWNATLDRLEGALA